jgi:tRNA 2-thiouridine synthesizing protein C
MGTSAKQKHFTFIARRSPYGSAHARAMLDMVLAAAVFDQKVTLIFMDDGVLQLRKNQAAAGIAMKDLSAALCVLPLYDIQEIFVESCSLLLRGMSPEELAIPATVCDSAYISTLVQKSDVVFTL